MRTTTIQIARILRDALEPKDLARVAEALEGYLVDNDPETGAPPNPTVARRTDVAGDLIDRIEALVGETPAAAPRGASADPAAAARRAAEVLLDGDRVSFDAASYAEAIGREFAPVIAEREALRDALLRADECLDRAEGAAERLRGDDGRLVREAIDDASEIVARALREAGHA